MATPPAQSRAVVFPIVLQPDRSILAKDTCNCLVEGTWRIDSRGEIRVSCWPSRLTWPEAATEEALPGEQLPEPPLEMPAPLAMPADDVDDSAAVVMPVDESWATTEEPWPVAPFSQPPFQMERTPFSRMVSRIVSTTVGGIMGLLIAYYLVAWIQGPQFDLMRLGLPGIERLTQR